LVNPLILGLMAAILGTAGVAGAAMVAGPGGAGMAGCAQMHAECQAEMARCADHMQTGDHSQCAMAGMSPQACQAMHSGGMMSGSGCH
jgi:hypothetical protein